MQAKASMRCVKVLGEYNDYLLKLIRLNYLI